MSEKVRDKLWIWGHPGYCFDDWWKHKPRLGKPMEPAPGMRDLGAKNIYYVPFGYQMDLQSYSQDLMGVARTGISIEDWGDKGTDRIKKSLEIARMFPKTTDRLIFDDFFCDPSHCGGWSEYTPADIRQARQQLNEAGYELWVVLYQWQLQMTDGSIKDEMLLESVRKNPARYADENLKEYLDEFDGVSFWFWNEPSIEEYLAFTAKFFRLTPNKQRMIGCYLWNFGLAQDATPKLVRYQLDANLALLRAGQIEGVILHNNALAPFNMPGYEEAKAWVSQYGDELI